MSDSTPQHLGWIAAAEKILRESAEPLHSKQIVQIAVDRKLVASSAKEPDHSLQAAIWRNIRRLGALSPFVLVGRGRRERKYWLKSKLKPSQKYK